MKATLINHPPGASTLILKADTPQEFAQLNHWADTFIEETRTSGNSPSAYLVTVDESEIADTTSPPATAPRAARPSPPPPGGPDESRPNSRHNRNRTHPRESPRPHDRGAALTRPNSRTW